MLVILKKKNKKEKIFLKSFLTGIQSIHSLFHLFGYFFISFHPSIERSCFIINLAFSFWSFLFFLSSFWIYKLGPFPVEHLSTNQNIQIPFYNFNFKFNLRFPILFSFRLFIYFYLDLSLVFFFIFNYLPFSQFGIINCISCPFNNNNTYN